jgi:hypothetical protein
MIQNKSRAGWFGASDTDKIMGNWDTETFRHWWLVKLGLSESRIETRYMRAGTAYEHKILDYIEWKDDIGEIEKDRQIKRRRLRLRVNLDGEDGECIYEVKTHQKPLFKVTKAYWMQAQVEMFATGKKLKIVAYHMEEENYINYFLPIDKNGITVHPIEYDWRFIEIDYIPRLQYLARCLKKGETPNARDFAQFADRLEKSKANRFLRAVRRFFRRIRCSAREDT